MFCPRKLNIYLNFQRLNLKFGERVANGNPGVSFGTVCLYQLDQCGEKERSARTAEKCPRLLKPVDSLSFCPLDFLNLRATEGPWHHD